MSPRFDSARAEAWKTTPADPPDDSDGVECPVLAPPQTVNGNEVEDGIAARRAAAIDGRSHIVFGTGGLSLDSPDGPKTPTTLAEVSG